MNFLVNGADLIPVGSIFWLATSTVSPGYLICNGAAVSRTTYNKLFNVIAVTYGSGDGVNTFNLPDLRGCFIRGIDNGRSYDTGRTFGSYQADDNKSHNHTITESDHNHTISQSNHSHGAWQDGHGHTVNQTAHSHGAWQDAHNHNGAAYHPWHTTNDSGLAEQNQTGGRETVTKFTDNNVVQPGVYTHGATANIWLDGATPGVYTHGATANITLAGAKTNITINNTGSESRPKNISLLPIIKF